MFEKKCPKILPIPKLNKKMLRILNCVMQRLLNVERKHETGNRLVAGIQSAVVSKQMYESTCSRKNSFPQWVAQGSGNIFDAESFQICSRLL